MLESEPMASIASKISRHKLSFSFLLIILLFISFGGVTIKGLFTLGKYTRTIYEHPLVVSNASLAAALNITKMHRSMKDVVLATSDGEMEAALSAVALSENLVHEQLETVRAKILGKEGQALERQAHRLFVDWKPIRNEVVQKMGQGNAAGAIAITKGKGADHVLKLETKMLELTSYARDKADNFLEAAEKSQARLERITIGLTLAGIILSLVIAVVATYLVSKARRKLQAQNYALQKALAEIKTLHGIIPICSHCKKIRDEKGLWNRLEEYIRNHSDAKFSHGICPSCREKHYAEFS